MKSRILGFFAVGLIAGLMAPSSFAVPVFSSASYNAVTAFNDGGPGTTMTLAWDGTNYYSGNGGFPLSPIVKYDAAGNVIASVSPTPGIDFRSVFTNSAGDLLARGVASRTIYRQTGVFGTFASLLTLSGGALDVQSAVVLNSDKTEYIARSGTTVSRWDLAGAFIGAVTLSSDPCSAYPAGRGIAAAGGYFLTYCGQKVYAYDAMGSLLDQATLIGAGTTFDSDFSYSFANSKFWVVDSRGGLWRGYDIGLGNIGVPEPGTLALFGLGLAGLGLSRRRKAA